MQYTGKLTAPLRGIPSLICCLGLLSVAVHAEDAPALAINVPMLDSQWKEAELTPDYLEENNAVIGSISIDNQNIFNLEDPEEDKWLYRLANGIHTTTRPKVIRSQLLFDTGSSFSEQQISESERLLRQNRYIREADIEVADYEDGVVDLNVRTRDVWTLKADIAFGRKGGVNTGGFGVEESNLMGTGAHIGAFFKRTVDRDISSINFANTHFRGSDYTLAGTYANNSDGYARQLSVFKPFISLNSRRAGGLTSYSGERVDSHYDLGKVHSKYSHQSAYHEVFRGWSKGLVNGWTRRLSAGLTFDEHRFGPAQPGDPDIGLVPEDRRFLYPFIGLEVVEDQFEKTKNVDQIHRTEDRFLGTRYGVQLGFSPSNKVSTEDTLHFRGEYRSGFKFDQSETLVTGVELSGRLEGSISTNTLVSAYAMYHRGQSKNRLFYASLTAAVGENLDLDNPVYLGGTNGLRGYPLRYQSGSSRALLTLEQRFFTDWYPFRLFRVGGAIFFDAGQTWGDNPVGSENLGLLRNVGLGLRLANTRSSQGRILHIDIAYPLDGTPDISGVQILIEAKRSF